MLPSEEGLNFEAFMKLDEWYIFSFPITCEEHIIAIELLA